MANIISINRYSDPRGSLVSIEKILPFDIKRVYYIYDVPEGMERGGHRHKKTIQAAICIQGSCTFFIKNQSEERELLLDSPDKCLIINPEDRHTMKFGNKAILMVLASEFFDKDDYIKESY